MRRGGPGGPRRGLHGRADGPSGRLRERGRLARHGADARPGGGDRPLRPRDRPRLRRRPGRPARRFDRRRGAVPADRVAGRGGDRRRDHARPRRPAARGQGPGRSHPRHARSLAGGHPHRPADHGVPHRLLRHRLRRPDGRRASATPWRRWCRCCARSATRSMRDGYLQALARRTGVEERVLLEAMHAPAGGRSRTDGRSAGPNTVRAASPPTRSCRLRTRSTRRRS